MKLTFSKSLLVAAMAVAMAACSGNKAQQEQEAANNPGEAPKVETALEKGQAYLTENAKRPEVTTTASGLQYEVLKAAEGEKPGPTDQVTVYYTGRLIDGSVFDSNQGGDPITFGLNQVIAGWTEGLQLMPVGSTYRLFIPSELAYGSRGASGVIGPDETLIFDVTLIAIPK